VPSARRPPGDPVAEGDVGNIVVTSLDLDHPWIRLALGDLTAALQGMFVRPEQIAEIGRRHPELGRLRLVVRREGETDVMTLRAEAVARDPKLSEAVTATLRGVTKLGGTVELVPVGALPNDGKAIVDER
jgi:phenylacetate-CoA ligase